MPSLQVRDLHEHIYKTLRDKAEREHRSIAQQAVAALARGLDLDPDPRSRRKAILKAIESEADSKKNASLPNPALMIREDRDR